MKIVENIDRASLHESRAITISSCFGPIAEGFKNILMPKNEEVVKDDECEDLPEQVEDLIDFLQCFESTNPKVLVRNALGIILFKGRVKDFDVDRLKDYPIPLNYEAYSADVRGDYLVINMKKIKE